MIYEAIKYLFPGIQDSEFALQDDGDGPYISRWDRPESQPAAQEISEAMPAVERAQMWDRIKAKRDELSDEGGYKVAVLGVDKWFHSDEKSKTQQLGLFIMGASVPAVQWKTMDGSFVTMTQAIAAAVFQAAASQDMAIFQAAETHRSAMEAAADPLAYDFSGGWPATFEGPTQ